MPRERPIANTRQTRIAVSVLVALCFGVALYFRIAVPYAQVFSGGWVRFTTVDAYYQMRIVDNLVHNFPHLSHVDPYMLYPGVFGIGTNPFFNYLIAAVAWLVGLGSPSHHTVDVVGAYFPAVLGALTVIPVYFIGKELFNRWAGVIAAALIAVMPGEFLGRSILGYTDYHVAEALFTTVTALFLILAVNSARRRQLTFDSLRHRRWAAIARPLVFSLLAGLFLGIYILTWAGALLFAFIFFVYFVVQFTIDHVKGRSSDSLCLVSSVTLLTALVVSLVVAPGKMVMASLVIAFVVPLVLRVLSAVLTSWRTRPVYYPMVVVGFGIATFIVFRLTAPSLLSTILNNLYLFTWTTKQTILEAQPLLFPGNTYSWSAVWGNFTTGFFLSIISIGILIYLVVRRGEADKTLLLVWSLVILAMTLAQRRFAYYYAVNVALLTGYLSWQILKYAGFSEPTVEPVAEPKPAKTKKTKARSQKSMRRFHFGTSQEYMVLGVVVVFFLSFFADIGGATPTARNTASFAPDDAWLSSLTWLKNNTPEPFASSDYYYQLYHTPFQFPASAYGVAAWWDYGYWITRIGHRIPNSNPGGGASGVVGSFFLSQDEASANKIMDSLGSQYVIADYDIIASKFWGVVTLSGRKAGEFGGVYYVTGAGDQLQPQLFLYPEFYRSLLVRLYSFNGDQVVPQGSTVISYEEKTTPQGVQYLQVTSLKSFPSYEEAQAYIASQKSGNYRIVGTSPFVSPVPLEKLVHHRLVYSSDASVKIGENKAIPEVKVFEYTK